MDTVPSANFSFNFVHSALSTQHLPAGRQAQHLPRHEASIKFSINIKLILQYSLVILGLTSSLKFSHIDFVNHISRNNVPNYKNRIKKGLLEHLVVVMSTCLISKCTDPHSVFVALNWRIASITLRRRDDILYSFRFSSG